MKKSLSPHIKDIINASMKISKAERAKSMDVFLKDDYATSNANESTIVGGSRTYYRDSEETIIDRKESVSPSDNSNKSDIPKRNSTNHKIGWLVLGAVVIVNIFLILYDSSTSPNSTYKSPQAEATDSDEIVWTEAEETTAVVDEETLKKQKEQDIKDSYISIIDTHSSKGQDDEWWSPCYFLYDITGDGIPELWLMIKDRTADAIDVSLLVYTYTEKGVKSIFNGSYGHPYHNYLCKGNRYILKVFAHMGEASWSKYTYKNGVISEQVVFSEELNESQEDYTQPSESEVNTFKLTDRAPINNIRINK